MTSKQQQSRCTYTGHKGDQCTGYCAAESPYCFWHDPQADKTGADVKEQLEVWLQEGHTLEGIQLKRANLQDIHLYRTSEGGPVDMRDADFYRAHLQGAHLYQANLAGASLMKADLSNANLNQTVLVNANLLGCRFDDAKIERVNWGDGILHEQQARAALKQGKENEARRLFMEAEEIYRGLRKSYEARGIFEEAGLFFQREMVMKRMQMPFFSLSRLLSKMVDIFAGYGERPVRIVIFTLVVILVCAVVYFFNGLEGPNGLILFDEEQTLVDNLKTFWKCVYFSVVTFTTLGYGDITPIGSMRPLAALEALIGSFSLALFVVVFVKKMTR